MYWEIFELGFCCRNMNKICFYWNSNYRGFSLLDHSRGDHIGCRIMEFTRISTFFISNLGSDEGYLWFLCWGRGRHALRSICCRLWRIGVAWWRDPWNVSIFLRGIWLSLNVGREYIRFWSWRRWSWLGLRDCLWEGGWNQGRWVSGWGLEL